MKKLMILVLLTLSFTILYSQKSINIFEDYRKNAISFSFFGPAPIVGITYERVLASKVSIEVGVGFPSVGLGVKIFPRNIEVSMPMFYVGVTGAYFASQESEMTPAPTFLVYIPFGLSRFGKGGFNFAFDIGPGYAYDHFIPYGNLKFGYRF